MTNMSTISIRVNADDKSNFEKFCSNTGMNITTAINIYIKAVLMHNQIPFNVKNEIPISNEIPNKITALSIQEGDKLIKDKSQPEFKNASELRKSLKL